MSILIRKIAGKGPAKGDLLISILQRGVPTDPNRTYQGAISSTHSFPVKSPVRITQSDQHSPAHTRLSHTYTFSIAFSHSVSPHSVRIHYTTAHIKRGRSPAQIG